MLPTVVIIGRRNVGKSALFNRLIEQNKAIVSDIEGTTRDRTEGICLWRGQEFRIVDTGGLDVGDNNTIDREIKKQTRFAIKEADIILFLVDARVGPQSADRVLAKELYKKSSQTPILLVANKAETKRWQERAQAASWKTLQLGIPLSISALTGQGVGDMLEKILEKLESPSPHGTERKTRLPHIKPDLRVAIIGKPNVGKSSLLNKILGEERVIVSPIAHTTREPQDTLVTIPTPPLSPPYVRGGTGGLNILLIDTAGIRRKARIEPGIEKAGVTKTFAVIKQADVVFFVLNTVEGIDFQDKYLAGMIEETGTGVIVIANKWDLLKTRNEHDKLIQSIHYSLPGITFAPVIFISALTGHNVHKLLTTALKTQENRQRIIPKEELKDLLPKLILRHLPTKGKGTRHPVIRRIEQTGTRPPAFMAVIGPKQSLHQSYLRFIQNRLREFYDFEGTPIKVFARQEKN